MSGLKPGPTSEATATTKATEEATTTATEEADSPTGNGKIRKASATTKVVGLAFLHPHSSQSAR
jgi:hypothetical protein